MISIIATTIIVASSLTILLWPYVGVLVWSVVTYMNPHRLEQGFAYDLPFAMAVAGLTVFSGWVLSREHKTWPWNPTTILLLALTAWICVTTAFAIYESASQEALIRALKILVFQGIITIALIDTRFKIIALVVVICASVGLHGVLGGIRALETAGAEIIQGQDWVRESCQDGGGMPCDG